MPARSTVRQRLRASERTNAAMRFNVTLPYCTMIV